MTLTIPQKGETQSEDNQLSGTATPLEDWMEKARGHKYTSRKRNNKGGWDYEYAADTGQGSLSFGAKTPPKTKPVVKTAPKKAESKAPAPAPEVKEVTPTVTSAVAPKVAPKVKPAPTSGQAKEAPTEKPTAQSFDLARQIGELGIEKQDVKAVKMALTTLQNFGQQKGQKGVVRQVLENLIHDARVNANNISKMFQSDKTKENQGKKITGREKYTYEQVLDARTIRDSILDTDNAVRTYKPPKAEPKVPAPKAEVTPPEAAKPKFAVHKEPNFRDYGKQSFKFDIPKTGMSVHVDQSPKIRSRFGYEQLEARIHDGQGNVAGTINLTLDAQGRFEQENVQVEGDLPQYAADDITDLIKEGLSKRKTTETWGEVAEAKEQQKSIPDKGQVHSISYNTKVVDKAKMAQQNRAGYGFSGRAVPSKTVTESVAVSLADENYTSPTAFARTQSWSKEAHAAVAKEYRNQAKKLGEGSATATAYRHAANAHAQMVKEKARNIKSGDGRKYVPVKGGDTSGISEHLSRMKAHLEKSMGNSMGLEDWLEKALPTHEARMGGAKSDTQGGSQDGGDWAGKGKTADDNGGAVDAPGIDAQGKVTGADPGKTDKLSEDDEEIGEIGNPTKKKPIETLGKSELYPSPLTPSRQRENMAYQIAVEVSRLNKSELVTIGAGAHPFSNAQTHYGADLDALSKAEGSTDIPSLAISRGQSIAQSHILCKSIHAGGCNSHHSAMLSACPDCGAGTVVSRVLPSVGSISVVPVADRCGLRLAKRDPMIKIIN